ncbi:hypothetical protein NE865_14435 [Phthorimaea operculella]|nr:hypothetical protein NE865_14435 [Phthorimaea operculella]
MQVGQELTRWARFLENFHSITVQNVIDHSKMDKNDIWPLHFDLTDFVINIFMKFLIHSQRLEMSHGDTDKVIHTLSRLLLEGDLKASAMSTVLQCLHVNATVENVFEHVAKTGITNSTDLELLVARISQYHKDGVRFTDAFIDKVETLAVEHGLPPHKQIGLLALSQKERVQDCGDMVKFAQYTLEVLKNEWPDLNVDEDDDDDEELNEDKLSTDEGRREVFFKFIKLTDTWHRKKLLVDLLICWPPIKDANNHSIHYEYLQHLLKATDQGESLVLIKLLLVRPVLSEDEVKSLAAGVSEKAVVNAIWIILLNNGEHSKADIVKLVNAHKDAILKQDIEDDLIIELLNKGMFLDLVSTPLYSGITNYLIRQDSSDGKPNSPYTAQWAIDKLMKANYFAEAGNLKLLSLGVPSALRGFSQSVSYVKDMPFN